MDITKYERTAFSEKTTNRSITKYGLKVGDDLVISHVAPHEYLYRENQYRVYRSFDGLPAIKTTFVTQEDAIRFAEWLDATYRDENGETYFILWTHYPEAELFRWTYLTIPRGEEYWEYLKDLEDKRNIKWSGYVPTRLRTTQ